MDDIRQIEEETKKQLEEVRNPRGLPDNAFSQKWCIYVVLTHSLTHSLTVIPRVHIYIHIPLGICITWSQAMAYVLMLLV